MNCQFCGPTLEKIKHFEKRLQDCSATYMCKLVRSSKNEVPLHFQAQTIENSLFNRGEDRAQS